MSVTIVTTVTPSLTSVMTRDDDTRTHSFAQKQTSEDTQCSVTPKTV